MKLELIFTIAILRDQNVMMNNIMADILLYIYILYHLYIYLYEVQVRQQAQAG